MWLFQELSPIVRIRAPRSRQGLFVRSLFDFLRVLVDLSVTNAAAKLSSVNTRGLNGEIPVALRPYVISNGVIELNKACLVLSGRSNLLRFLPWMTFEPRTDPSFTTGLKRTVN
jgi:hypothetical protein